MTAGLVLGATGALLAAPGLTAAHAAADSTAYRWGGWATGSTKVDIKDTPTAKTLPAPIEQVASSNSTDYALLTNGAVYAWGVGTQGELGNGAKKTSKAAVKVKFPAGVKIAFLPIDVMPFDTAFAVDTTGQAWGWGDNAGGELCLGNKTSYDAPVKLPFTQVTTLAGGDQHASYDSGGTLYSCGANTDGVLGDGAKGASTSPVQVSGLSGASVSTLVASWNNEGALLTNGDYDDWGYNAGGQLGDGTTANSAVPVQISLPAKVTQVALGGSLGDNGQTIVLLSTGALYAWGTDSDYQLGDGQTKNEKSPELITPPSGVTYQTLASGGATSYAISTTGDVYAWGWNASGQVGNGTISTSVKNPTKVLSGMSAISATASNVVAADAAAARPATGSAGYRWGGYGAQVPNGYRQLSPLRVTLPAPVKQVASSNTDDYALLTNGTVWAWGVGSQGELGDGQTVNSPTAAVKVKFPSGVKIAFLPTDVMPYDTAFAVSTTGRAWGWGDNAGGELCLGNKKSYDAPVKLPFTQVSTLAGGSMHASYDSGGTLYSCGTSSYGALGAGTTTISTIPVKVQGLNGSSVTTLAGSWNDEGALLANGDYYDWGYNPAGQLGDGTTTDSAAPVQVSLPAKVTQVAQGGSLSDNGQTLVMLSTGAVYGWGNDKNYQLGDGKAVNETSPELITPPAGVTYRTLASAGYSSYAIDTSGNVWAWGGNGSGQIGNGTTKTAKEPVEVLSGMSLISATAYNVVTAATGSPAQPAATATAYRWGGFGGGGGKNFPESSPVPVSLPAPIKQIATSNSTSYALLTNGNVYAWGVGTQGELGNGQTLDSPTVAAKVKFPTGVKIAFLPVDVMPYDTAFAVDTTGHAWGWGDNEMGELCLDNTTAYDTPVELPFKNVTTLDGGAQHATYDAGGTLYSCGSSGSGALGTGTVTSSTTPVKVKKLDGASVTTLTGSWNDEGALLANGDYYDWGFNSGGQLGDGTTTNSAVPVQVTLPAAVTQAALGGSVGDNGQTLVLLSTGKLYAWGTDSTYQLGDGKTKNETSPELITPPSGVTYRTLATAGASSYGISTTGDVWAWGFNATGQVGNGTTKNVKKPVEVLSGVSLISATAANVAAAAS